MEDFPKIIEILKVSNTKEGNGVYSIDLVIQFDAVEVPVVENTFTARKAYTVFRRKFGNG